MDKYILWITIRKTVADIAEGKSIGEHIEQKLSDVQDIDVKVQISADIDNGS